jgi:hypothetical protein
MFCAAQDCRTFSEPLTSPFLRARVISCIESSEQLCGRQSDFELSKGVT